MQKMNTSEQQTLPEEFWEWYSLGALFGDTPSCRIIQFLSVHRSLDYTLKEIARAKLHGGLEIELVKISDLLKNNRR